MSAILANLNESQKQAVLYNEGPLAIIAGAGSGKTRTITHKIAYLIETKKAVPRQILAVTFTNKAADEMKHRVTELVGDVGKRVWISTYHSLCARILREDIDKIGISKRFNIIDPIDQKYILRKAYKKYDINYKTISFRSTIEYISKCKNNQSTPEELLDVAQKDIDKVMAKIYKFYLLRTKKTNSLDFDDLLIYTHKLFLNNQDVAQKWNKRFTHILVDEFQDTSIIQYEIIKTMAANNNIVVVGDPDQTIYTWRHADASLIMNFKTNFSNAKVILLEQNYRSTPNILDAANMLIANNKRRIHKNLFSLRERGIDIVYHHAFSEDAEAKWVANEIKELTKSKTQLRNIAILYRSGYLTNILEKALINENINYVIYGGMKFYQREEIKDIIAFLKVINNGDSLSLRRIINVPSRKIGASSQDRVFEFLDQKGSNTFQLLIDNFNDLPLQKKSHYNLSLFINLVRKYQKALETNGISFALKKFLIEVDYYAKWNFLEDQSRRDNINQLISSIKKWEQQNKDKKLNDYLEEISLYVDQDLDFTSSKNFVSLMTVHSSKGLEFDNVFVYGFSEEVFPSKRAIIDDTSGEALEEERRLAYVAITRTKNRLYLSSSRGYASDYKTYKVPSRFIQEIGINPQKFSGYFISPKDFEDNYNKSNDFIEGEKIFHDKFGTGVIISMQGEIIEVAFKDPHGVKTMIKKHKSLRKVME